MRNVVPAEQGDAGPGASLPAGWAGVAVAGSGEGVTNRSVSVQGTVHESWCDVADFRLQNDRLREDVAAPNRSSDIRLRRRRTEDRKPCFDDGAIPRMASDRFKTRAIRATWHNGCILEFSSCKQPRSCPLDRSSFARFCRPTPQRIAKNAGKPRGFDEARAAPAAISRKTTNCLIFPLGQRMTQCLRLSVSGPAGDSTSASRGRLARGLWCLPIPPSHRIELPVVRKRLLSENLWTPAAVPLRWNERIRPTSRPA